MTTNPYSTYASPPPGPSPDAFTVTPSDSVAFTTAARWLYVGSGGNVTLITSKGTTVLFANTQIGELLPIGCQQVMATGTTATLMLGLI
jgi:hypothetical protein